MVSEPWDFFGRNDAKVETPVLWPPHAKSWLVGKDSDAGRDWGQEEKGTTEDKMAGWHHWLDGHESQWILGVGDGQGGLACCDSWGRGESDTTERLIWSDLIWSVQGPEYINLYECEITYSTRVYIPYGNCQYKGDEYARCCSRWNIKIIHIYCCWCY